METANDILISTAIKVAHDSAQAWVGVDEQAIKNAILTPEITIAIETFKRFGYEPIERALAREHTTTFYLLNCDMSICYRDGLAEQLRQHTSRC